MRKQPGTASRAAGILTVLSVSTIEEDHRYLQEIIGRLDWSIFKAHSVPAALALLRGHHISVVICERNLRTGTWIDLLDNMQHLPHMPKLIVTSRLADDRLWAEALNLGAWDVLAKPFDRSELLRTLQLAWLHWHHQLDLPAMSLKAMTA